MNRYVIEHRKIVGGVRKQPILASVEEVYALDARTAGAEARKKYLLTEDDEYLCVRPLEEIPHLTFAPVECSWGRR